MSANCIIVCPFTFCVLRGTEQFCLFSSARQAITSSFVFLLKVRVMSWVLVEGLRKLSEVIRQRSPGCLVKERELF